MSAGDWALFVIVGIGAAFWCWVVPVIVTCLIASGAVRGFFGLPVVVWRGIEEPGEIASIVLETADSAGTEKDEEDESDVLSKMR